MDRHGAWTRLQHSLLGPLRESAFRHRCRIGCHSTAQEVCKELVQDICRLWVSHPPPVPAWNKWSKVWPAIAWFGTFSAIHSVLPICAAHLCELCEDDTVILGITEGEGELDEAAQFRLEEQRRFRKMSRWLRSQCTPDKLLVLCITLRSSIDLLEIYFKGARRYEPTHWQSVLPFIGTQSPPFKVIEKALEQLQDENHPAWRPLVGAGRGWTERLRVLASVAMWMFVGHLFKRFVLAFQQWPWPLVEILQLKELGMFL